MLEKAEREIVVPLTDRRRKLAAYLSDLNTLVADAP